jgi:hypothetical protein
MTRLQRVKYAYSFIRFMAKNRPHLFERTVSRFVAQTYGLETELVKRMKARFRCELSFAGDGK